jgi:hypothetical protein
MGGKTVLILFNTCSSFEKYDDLRFHLYFYLSIIGLVMVGRMHKTFTFALKNTTLDRLNKKNDENFFLYLKSSNFAARKLKSQAN